MEKTMKTVSRTLLPILALAASVSIAQAQPQPGHQGHHPAGQGAAQAAPSILPDQPPQGGMQGMMGGMMPMMRGMMGQQGDQAGSMPMSCPMMGQMGGMGAMGMPFEHIEGRVAFLKAELGITDAQAKEWNAFADALRANADVHRAMHERMMKGDQPSSLAERLERREAMLSSRLDAVKKLNAAAKPLFASLSEEQRKAAEDLLGRSLGMI
ncbi:Spy/CpxP family protein refolding chaperone [Azospirillum rugosum]|uniref:LTXXQ motif family protein n=2 Tax=Azospirillum brasilense TaxID=192 RepID=A0A6L3B1G3_AZOBR|nr:hypothetical protein DS837_10655 [Azospirillum brasilense]